MKSVIIGAGTYGEVYLAYLLEMGVDIVGEFNLQMQSNSNLLIISDALTSHLSYLSC